ncbi:MAG: hypothetical protein S4CHLAM6_15730 [Chlamydiae bacterium]|nr:hypothetical protein [Chlamydiota bacterium]
MNYTKRHALTLIEIMLVIVLIGIVGGALAFNLSGALDKGKAFKTEETHKKIEAILSIQAIEDGPSVVLDTWPTVVGESPIVKVKKVGDKIVDAWGNPFEVELDPNDGSFLVSSAKIGTDGKIIK